VIRSPPRFGGAEREFGEQAEGNCGLFLARVPHLVGAAAESNSIGKFIHCDKYSGGVTDENKLKTRRPRSGRVPDGNWNTDNERLNFNSNTTDNRNDNQGCRLAGSLAS